MQDFIKEIYENHKDDLDMFGFEPDECDDSVPNSYVYAWFTKGENKRFFYIGKGKNQRYNHILKEIETYEKNNRKYKGEKYKIIKDYIGIDVEFLYNGLTEKEATILEAYQIMKCLQDKHPLLNVILPNAIMEDDVLYEYRNSYFYEKDNAIFLEFYK